MPLYLAKDIFSKLYLIFDIFSLSQKKILININLPSNFH